MIKKIVNTVLAGFYIGLGATAYFMIDNKVLGSIFFCAGILLVMNFYNMLFTRVCPLSFLKEYSVGDAILTFIGNTVGGFICALLVKFTRIFPIIEEKFTTTVQTKLNDSLLSIVILGILCGIMVAYAVFAAKKYESQKGIAIFFYILFVALFVVCGFEHVVANAFYYSLYILKAGATTIPAIILPFLASLLGNIIGGGAVALLEKYRNA